VVAVRQLTETTCSAVRCREYGVYGLGACRTGQQRTAQQGLRLRQPGVEYTQLTLHQITIGLRRRTLHGRLSVRTRVTSVLFARHNNGDILGTSKQIKRRFF
jgi:hypothetical protein